MTLKNTPTAPRTKHRGFAMVELIIALSITALIALFAAYELRHNVDETSAKAAAHYLQKVAMAAETQVQAKFEEYANGSPVTGFANPLRPTLAELRAAGRLEPSFPIADGAMPTRQNVSVIIDRLNCPGDTCRVRVLACTATPIQTPGGNVRFDLASSIMQELKGRGAQSLFGSGGTLTGQMLTIANPMGNVPGIVCATSAIDTELYDQFLRMGDSRDPKLKGELSVAKDMKVGNCAHIMATTGRAGFGCENPEDIPAGWKGGVRSPDVVATNVLSSDNPKGFTGNNGNYAFMGITNGVAEIRTSGRAAANRLTPTGSYAPGSACTADDEASIARSANASGLVMCVNNAWRTMVTHAHSGQACSPEGKTATSDTGEMLYCINGKYTGMKELVKHGTPGAPCTAAGTTAINASGDKATLVCKRSAGGVLRYYHMGDVTTNLTFVRSVDAYGDSFVRKPLCAPGSGGASFPVIQLIAKQYASSDGAVNILALDSGDRWQVKMTNGEGQILSGTEEGAGKPLATAYLYCFFP